MRTNKWPLQEADNGEGKGNGGADGDGGKDADLGTVEERAARMGWVPKEKFRGDPERWTDAATFVKNGEESLPILRERLRKLEAANVDYAKTVSELKKQSDTAYERAYAKAKKELESEVKRAAKAGDEEAAAAASRELAELEAEKAERNAKADDSDPVFDGWVAQNTWYSDPEMKVEAETIAFKLRRRGDKTEGVAFLDKVKDELKKQFPEKFGNPRRAAPGGVERPSGGGEGGGGGKKGWDQLPAEAKDSGERYIKQKLYPNKQAYAEAYWAQN
jgi:hypothetical protein